MAVACSVRSHNLNEQWNTVDSRSYPLCPNYTSYVCNVYGMFAIYSFCIAMSTITVTSDERLKSPTAPPIVQKLVHVDNKENIKNPHYRPICDEKGKSTGYRWNPSQCVSDEESVSMSWHHNNFAGRLSCMTKYTFLYWVRSKNIPWTHLPNFVTT